MKRTLLVLTLLLPIAAFGQESIRNVRVTHNVFIGPYAGYSLLEGDGNLMIGNRACHDLMRGSYNICLGEGSSLPENSHHKIALPNGRVMSLDGVLGDADMKEIAETFRQAMRGLRP